MPIDLETPNTEEALLWVPRESAPGLAQRDLHLWRVPTGTPLSAEELRLRACLEMLGQDQRTRAKGMTHGTYRGRYILAQAGLRRILGLYLDAPPASLVFRYGPAGKPALADAPPGFEFNLTTAGELALVGISLGSALGVDCEQVRPRRGLTAIARRMFERGRAESIAALPEPEALDAFYRAWTALEADAKADGRGLFRPRPAGDRPPEVRHCVPARGYIAAVARARLPPLGAWQALELMDDRFR
jgi:4'-phosphopantetheinyl transferase